MLFGGLAKVATLLARHVKLEWQHAWLFGVLTYLVHIAGAFAHKAGEFALPLAIALPIALLAQLAAGGWYLGLKATTLEGKPLLFKGGVLLVLATFVLAMVLAALVATVFRFHFGSASF